MNDPDFDAFNAWKRKERQEKLATQQQAAIEDEKRINEKQWVAITDESRIASNQQDAIERQNDIENLKKHVQSARSALSDAGKDRVEREINTLKGNPQALQALGIPK